MGEWVLGSDVSDFQPDDDATWDRMVADGAEYFFVKQNQDTFECEKAVSHRLQANRRGKPVGGYTWATFNSPAKTAAQVFAKLLQQGPHELGAVWDVEDVYPNGSPTGASPAQRADWIEEGRAELAAEMGPILQILYTGGWYWEPYVEPRASFAEMPLWLAAYPGGTGLPSYLPTPPAPWPETRIWQFAGDVPYFGLDSTDLNVTTRTNLTALTGGATPTTPGGLTMADAASLHEDIVQLGKDVEKRFNGFRVEVATSFAGVNAHTDQVAMALGKTLGAKTDQDALLLGRTVMDHEDENDHELAQLIGQLKGLKTLGYTAGDEETLKGAAVAAASAQAA